jgi:hypothetical protein
VIQGGLFSEDNHAFPVHLMEAICPSTSSNAKFPVPEK